MDIDSYLQHSLSAAAMSAARFYLSSDKGRRFAAGLPALLARAASQRRRQQREGLQVPPYIIASIAASCNLHCRGCYARGEGLCHDTQTVTQAGGELSATQWGSIFDQAADLGVCVMMLAGGEPLLRPEVLQAAGQRKNLLFPVFSNGLLLQGELLELFDDKRQLIPVLSIEGGAERTDERRGSGVAAQLQAAMQALRQRRILFACSITVTRENLDEVTRADFLRQLHDQGCGLVFFVEYVPLQVGTDRLTLDQTDTEQLAHRLSQLKPLFDDMTLVSFPGDEAKMGGCLAAGRGFFHISPNGAAEPCPFSPYSRLTLATNSLEQVLRSDFFRQVRQVSAADLTHQGGCTLFRHASEIEQIEKQARQ